MSCGWASIVLVRVCAALTTSSVCSRFCEFAQFHCSVSFLCMQWVLSACPSLFRAGFTCHQELESFFSHSCHQKVVLFMRKDPIPRSFFGTAEEIEGRLGFDASVGRIGRVTLITWGGKEKVCKQHLGRSRKTPQRPLTVSL